MMADIGSLACSMLTQAACVATGAWEVCVSQVLENVSERLGLHQPRAPSAQLEGKVGRGRQDSVKQSKD